MNSAPDPAFCYATSLHTDAKEIYALIEQARREETRTGLATGVLRASTAAAFRRQKLELSANRPVAPGAPTAPPRSLFGSAS